MLEWTARRGVARLVSAGRSAQGKGSATPRQASVPAMIRLPGPIVLHSRVPAPALSTVTARRGRAYVRKAGKAWNVASRHVLGTVPVMVDVYWVCASASEGIGGRTAPSWNARDILFHALATDIVSARQMPME